MSVEPEHGKAAPTGVTLCGPWCVGAPRDALEAKPPAHRDPPKYPPLLANADAVTEHFWAALVPILSEHSRKAARAEFETGVRWDTQTVWDDNGQVKFVSRPVEHLASTDLPRGATFIERPEPRDAPPVVGTESAPAEWFGTIGVNRSGPWWSRLVSRLTPVRWHL